ncbi:uncharacterized protein LOC116746697 [Phocoena sinus]|uniref:uncharacterized protein LOC116746697 n=1 Tax=Phocoena sinus TaxID=42100 RepID=UPI0013C3E5C6|nr:uncharacterized protein LOC116746697 [Phocoena sinus]
MNRKHLSGSPVLRNRRLHLGRNPGRTRSGRSTLPQRPPVTPGDADWGRPLGRLWRRRRGLTSGPRSPGLAAGLRAARRPAERLGALFGECVRAVRARPRAVSSAWARRPGGSCERGSAPSACGGAARPASAAPPESLPPPRAPRRRARSQAPIPPGDPRPAPPSRSGRRLRPQPETWRRPTPERAPFSTPLQGGPEGFCRGEFRCLKPSFSHDVRIASLGVPRSETGTKGVGIVVEQEKIRSCWSFGPYASGTFHGMEHGWAGWTAEDRELTQQTPDLTGASPAEPALERFWRSPSRSSPPWLHLDAPGSLKKYSFLDSIPGGLIQVVWGRTPSEVL